MPTAQCPGINDRPVAEFLSSAFGNAVVTLENVKAIL
jgi:hypothetical protein